MAVPFVPLNWRQTADELAWQLRDADITVLVVDEERATVAKAACADLPVTIVPIAELERSPPPVERLERATPDRSRAGSGGHLHLRDQRAAKGCSHHLRQPLVQRDRLCPPPRSSPRGRLAGGDAPVPRRRAGHPLPRRHRRDSGDPPRAFRPESALAAIDDGVTLLSVVPAMLQRMLDARGDAPWPPTSALRSSRRKRGAAAAHRGVRSPRHPGRPDLRTDRGHVAGNHVAAGAGASQAISSGLPLPLTEVRIVTEAGVAPPGEVGEIEIRGPTVFAGYIGDHSAGSRDLADGWFRTGDAGYLDSDGYLYVVDRRDDLIVSGGENIYPAEIERVLREHPSVLDAGVIGVPDESGGAARWPRWSGAATLIDARPNSRPLPAASAAVQDSGSVPVPVPSCRGHPPGSSFAAPCARRSANRWSERRPRSEPVQSWTAVRSAATAVRLSSRMRTISSTCSRLTISGGA